MRPNTEIEHLQDLINDFGVDPKISGIVAFDLLRIRYETIEKGIPQLLDSLKKKLKESEKDNPKSSLSNILPMIMQEFCISFHLLLFRKILKNAGKFRNEADPNNGYIGFGGENRRRIGSHKFHGETPKNIDLKIKKILLLFTFDSQDPIRNALSFYRQFVKIHPFYDANGRIGRLLLSIYLQNFELYVKWSEIETGGNKTKFIKKLNACHIREDDYNYDKYFERLYQFFNKFVIQTEKLKNP